MFKFASIALLAGLTAAPALAAASGQPLEFERDGVHYVGKVVNSASGAQRITGHEVETGRDFVLDVFKGRVTGRYDGQLVSYPIPAARPATFATAASAGGR